MMMWSEDRIDAPRIGGFTLARTLVAVVVVGVAGAIGVPWYTTARERTYDEAAVRELKLAGEAVDAYAARHGEYPASIEQAGFTPASGVDFTLWTVQTVGDEESVHLHARHERSSHQFHAHHPAEKDVRSLPWEW